jgi:small-conductance mechanosensitive channel
MDSFSAYFEPSSGTGRLIASGAILLLLWLLKVLTCSVTRRKISDFARFYHWRRVIVYSYSFFAIILVGRVWVEGIDSVATFLGLASAGLAIAMHDTIANLAGWFFILWRQPFKVGDRIEIGNNKGDVIDVRIFEFSMIEIGNWVDADQNTGRILHVPNSSVLREPLANYEAGFEYIWHEVPVLITFESDWEKAKKILSAIARDKAEHLSEGAEAQMRHAAMKYLIFFKKLTPIVYTTVKECGVQLTMRYIVKPRQRRGSEQEIWEAILRAFARESSIDLAYPTTRFYRSGEGQLKRATELGD